MATECKQSEFEWTQFYVAVADKLLEYQNNRTELVNAILEHSNPRFNYLRQDKFSDGRISPLEDICPFTVFGTFNRLHLNDEAKQITASEIARILNVSLPIPNKFYGIPVLNGANAWFFSFAIDREIDDIEKLWKLFINALNYSDNRNAETRRSFLLSYDDALKIKLVRRKLSIGLHWARPWDFVPFDKRTRGIIDELNFTPNRKSYILDGSQYLKYIDKFTNQFKENDFSVRSFPELCMGISKNISHDDEPELTIPKPNITGSLSSDSYTSQSILDDGCFLDTSEVENLVERLRQKKNLILQGPPGTGKTWIAKRIAYALMGSKDNRKVMSVQFHSNLSYEDFVRGWRPNSEGKLDLVDGFFMNLINDALKDPDSKFVAIIEEINRGHPSHIFGDLLTLLESDKRSPEHAIQLCHSAPNGASDGTYIPDNVYIVGTMNTADRSLALIDFAFRRRFAFASFEPRLGSRWRNWVTKKGGVDSTLVIDIEQRMEVLNEQIADDLGKDFQIGHSFVTPVSRIKEGSTREWFRQVVETEVGPLLEEYWFDSLQKAKETKDELLKDW